MPGASTRGALVALLFLAWFAFPADAQSAAMLIGSARTHLDAGRHADAARLLRLAIQPQAQATRDEKLEALVLLGVSELLGGHDSLARRAFADAVTIDPNLEVEGLGDIDPRLPALLAEAKSRGANPTAPPTVAPPPPPPPTSPDRPSVYECMPQCVSLDEPPRVTTMPRIAIPDGARPINQTLRVVAEMIVDTAGGVEENSIKLNFLNARGVERDIVTGLRGLRFRPGRVRGEAVRVRVELTFGPRWVRNTLLVDRPADPR
jgi:hypothetical protein